jgi:hypothetical protein
MKNKSFEVRVDRVHAAFVDIVEPRTIPIHANVERQRYPPANDERYPW